MGTCLIEVKCITLPQNKAHSLQKAVCTAANPDFHTAFCNFFTAKDIQYISAQLLNNAARLFGRHILYLLDFKLLFISLRTHYFYFFIIAGEPIVPLVRSKLG